MNVPSPLLIVALWLVAFPLFWCGVVWSLGVISGWNRLGRRFGTRAAMPENARGFIYGRLGWIGYNGVLSVAVAEDAVWIDVVGLFRPGHPRLRIPRAEVSNHSRRVRWFRLIDVFEVDGVRFALRCPIQWGARPESPG